MSESSNSSGGGCCGCITFVVVGLAIWALIFGVTVGGKHYGIKGCDTDGGLHFDTGGER